MKKLIIVLLLLPCLAFAQQKGEKTTVLKTQLDSVSYMFGNDIGEFLKTSNMGLDVNVLMQGIKDWVGGTQTFDQPTRMAYLQEWQSKKEEVEQTKNRAVGDKFLADNKSKSGVKTTASGLQYKVEKTGSGKKPLETDKVKVHYKGTLIDGTVFDSSYDRGEPITFGLNQVIKGWTEGVQLMNVGSKYIFYIPSSLGYGERSTGSIPANSVLIFEVELLDINPAE